MGNNRAGFKKLMDKYGIKNKSFNNHKIGFKRSDILAVKDKLKEERQKKNLKGDRNKTRGRKLPLEKQLIPEN